jgi:tripartite-type tricarboxylate transporter receptor subunit TctC
LLSLYYPKSLSYKKIQGDFMRTTSRRHVLGVAGATVLASNLGLSNKALAQADDYPSRSITMVVPFPPGGVADAVGRPVAEALSRILKQPVVVENRAGAGGGIGMAHVAKARADGYTILMALSSITILPEADKVLGRASQYQLNQLKPIARFTADPTVLVVHADSPWQTYAEFMRFAKSKPGALTFGSSGSYGTMHVPMELLKQNTNSFMVHVPYTGAGPAIVGLLGKQVDALATGPASIVQHVRAGRVRALAHWGEGRLAALPEVPSLTELGARVGFSQWAGLFVPAGVPDSAVAKLRDASKQAAVDARVVQVLNTAGSPIQYLDAPEFDRYVGDEAKRMEVAVKRIGKVD